MPNRVIAEFDLKPPLVQQFKDVSLRRRWASGDFSSMFDKEQRQYSSPLVRPFLGINSVGDGSAARRISGWLAFGPAPTSAG